MAEAFLTAEKPEQVALMLLSSAVAVFPWDTAFQVKWLKFVAAFGARHHNKARLFIYCGGRLYGISQ